MPSQPDFIGFPRERIHPLGDQPAGAFYRLNTQRSPTGCSNWEAPPSSAANRCRLAFYVGA